jgi:hypothetical protein
MKTPREILLDRHRPAGPKLDAVRETALAAAFPGAERDAKQPVEIRAPFAIRVAHVLWRELFLPCRRIWAGLAAVWLVILILNMPDGEKHAQLAQVASPPDREVLAVLREQREMLAQFIEPMVLSPAIRPKTPGPRGELVQTITLV